MKRLVLTLALSPIVMAGAMLALSNTSATADPYRWCAQYGGRGGGTNCYFMTFQQCQASISGRGGFCNPNPFYDGRPVRTPEDGPPRRRRR